MSGRKDFLTALSELKEELDAIEERLEANNEDYLNGAGPDAATGYFETEDFGGGLPFEFRLLLQIAKDQGRLEVLRGAYEGLEMAFLASEGE